MNKFASVLFGLVLLILGILAWAVWLPEWGQAALQLLKGGIVWLILFIGLIMVIIGLSEIGN